MKTLKLLPLLAVALLLSGCETVAPLPLTTETLTIDFHNSTSRLVHLSFNSEHRDVAWPGNGRVYLLQPGEEREYRLECRTTEKVCWGASPASNYSQYWGSGAHNDQACEDCCYICGTFEAQRQVLYD